MAVLFVGAIALAPSSSWLILLLAVDFSVYLFNFSNAFNQLFVMVKEYRHEYWMESHILNGIGAAFFFASPVILPSRWLLRRS